MALVDSTVLSAKYFLINHNVLLRHKSCTTFSDFPELQQSKTHQNDLETVEDGSEELISLRRYLPPEARIIVGGRAAPAYREALSRNGALVVGSLAGFCDALDRLRKERVFTAIAPRS